MRFLYYFFFCSIAKSWSCVIFNLPHLIYVLQKAVNRWLWRHLEMIGRIKKSPCSRIYAERYKGARELRISSYRLHLFTLFWVFSHFSNTQAHTQCWYIYFDLLIYWTFILRTYIMLALTDFIYSTMHLVSDLLYK